MSNNCCGGFVVISTPNTGVRIRPLLFIGISTLLVVLTYVGSRHFAAANTTVSQTVLYRIGISEQTILEQREVSQPPILKAHEGDQVELRVTSELAAELYIHGLEVTATLVPNLEASLIFPAKYAGRYYVHLHDLICSSPPASDESHFELAVIEVDSN
jgi:heme/copper-type cytochrome/quinol oxidase subunit 2